MASEVNFARSGQSKAGEKQYDRRRVEDTEYRSLIINCITFAHLSVVSTPLSQGPPSCCGCWCDRLFLHSRRSLRRRCSRLRSCCWGFAYRRSLFSTRFCDDGSASTGRATFTVSFLACCCHSGCWTFCGLSAWRARGRVLRCGFCWATRRLFRDRRWLCGESRLDW